ncbi:MAG: hypothetical protein ACK50V_09345 [Alphaproteobacteria bacterium]
MILYDYLGDEKEERQLDGINKAKEFGVAFGRKKKLTPLEQKPLKKRENGTLIKDLMKEFNLSKASVYLYLR